MKKLLEMLGLKPEATEDEVIAALTVLRNKASHTPCPSQEGNKGAHGNTPLPKEVTEALGLKEGASLSEVTGTILALKQPGNAVSVQEFQALKTRLAEKERDEQVTLAMKEGKITAAQKPWADEYAMRDIEGFKVFVAKAPVVVPMGKIPEGEPKGNLGKSQENLNLVYDLAYQKGIGVSESASLIGKAMTGNVEMLGRYFLEFRNLNETLGEHYTNSQAAAYAMSVLQEKVAGASEKMTEHARLVKEVAVAWKDFTQWVGDLFLKTVDLGAKGFEYLFKSWDARKLAEAKTDLDALSKALDNVGDTSKQTAREQAAAFKKANELTKEQTRIEKAEVVKRKVLEKELLDVRIKNYHDAVTELKATLADGERRYRDYRDEVFRLEGEIKGERGKSETFLRDIRRRFMSESQRNISILRDAEGNLSQAKQAFARGDYEVAAEFFRKAQADYETLEGEMKSKNQTFAGTTQKYMIRLKKGIRRPLME